MPTPTLGVAIPCYHPHIPRLEQLLLSIEDQTSRPDEVVVSCSGCTDNDVRGLLNRWSFPVTIKTHPARKNAAQNRNIAARALGTEYVSFFDADDIMHPQRLEIIRHAFATTRVDLVMHGCLSPPSPEFAQPFQIYPRPWPLSVNPAGRKAPEQATRFAPHHGQLSATRELVRTVAFPENLSLERREDSEFVDQVIARAGTRSAFIDLALSKYETAGSWVGAPEGSGVYALDWTARFGYSVLALPGLKRSRLFSALQSTWRALPLSIRGRFLR